MGQEGEKHFLYSILPREPVRAVGGGELYGPVPVAWRMPMIFHVSIESHLVTFSGDLLTRRKICC